VSTRARADEGLRVCETFISNHVSPGAGRSIQICGAREFFCRVTALMLCIRARLQSGRNGPTKIRALAPGLFFGPEFSPDKVFRAGSALAGAEAQFLFIPSKPSERNELSTNDLSQGLNVASEDRGSWPQVR